MNYLVIDLEMCNVPRDYRSRSYKYANETIQIGAVLLDEEFKRIGTLSQYVHPEHGVIDPFIQNLTGIRNSQVKKAPRIEEALLHMIDWIGDREYKVYAWSGSDRAQLLHEIKAKKICDERILDFVCEARWIDYQDVFVKRFGIERKIGLEEALGRVEIEPEGRLHDGLDDAGSDNSSSKADLPGDDASTDTGNTGGSSDGTSADNDTPVYSDPSANGFSDGEKDDFNSGKNDTPELSPTPTPTLDDRTTYFDPYYRKGDPNITDGDEPFYQKLDADSVPFTGSGTEDDPYVYLCSSAKEKVTVMGSFFNKLAGYSSDGTKIVHQGGYWYRLEFHQNDTIEDYDNLKTSCTGYYLVNGSLLEKPVYEFAEVEFTLSDADKYDENPDDGGDDNPGGGDDEPTGTPVSRADAIKYQKSKIASLKLDLQESDIKISQLEKKANKKLISAKLDGTVTYVGDSGGGETTDGKALIKVKSSDGFYVIGSVSELMLDDIKEGTKLDCTSYTSGSFEAEVMDVSEYPVTGNSFYGSSNPNVSYYAFTAVVSDKTLQLEDQDWVTVNYEASATENSMVIQKAFVRNDNNKNYVYKDDNGILKKQEISAGATVDSGYSVIVKGGLSEDDLIAFPYGKDVKEGAKTKEVTLDQMYGY